MTGIKANTGMKRAPFFSMANLKAVVLVYMLCQWRCNSWHNLFTPISQYGDGPLWQSSLAAIFFPDFHNSIAQLHPMLKLIPGNCC